MRQRSIDRTYAAILALCGSEEFAREVCKNFLNDPELFEKVTIYSETGLVAIEVTTWTPDLSGDTVQQRFEFKEEGYDEYFKNAVIDPSEVSDLGKSMIKKIQGEHDGKK